MSCDVITPHLPSVAGAASSSAAAAAAASATSLAPGFRFHPTDEELVSYYLKRKVLSRPFAVDAISEVDLYKAEPWDLPGKSRIQSRDMEWYFFSPLDKKYSNRSRTNRATGQGYWKTTGKDRPVRRSSRTVGMKKTLVFHAGRAPKGQRTNWVMHEYRLEDEELIRAGVSQDAYVVCRIFQKSGPGPQNGAQYGAPLIEDEWEDDGRFLVQSDQGAGLPLLTFGDQLCTHSDDFEQKNVGMDDEQDSASPLARSVDDQNIDVSPVNPTSLPAEAYENQFVNDVDENVNVLELNDDPYSIGMFDINSLSVSPQNDDTLIDDYLELNDLENPLETENFTQDADVLVTGIRNDQVPMDLLGNYNSLPDVHGVEEFFETEDGIGDLSEQEISTTSEDLYLNAKDMLTSDFPFGERADHGMVFDASSQNPIVEQGGFLEMNDFLDPVMVGSSAPDPVDEMIAYFDATEDNLQYPNIDNVDATSFFAEVERNSKEMYQPSPQASTEYTRDGASSSTEVPFTFAKSKASSDISFAGPDTLHESGWDTNTLKGRLINMLGSISSPPAIALESKAVALNTAVHTSGSIHIAAGMIQINGLPINGGGKHWPAPKSEDVGFLLSYDVTRTDVCTNPVGFEHVGKMHCNSLSLVIRSGFCLSFFSVLFLGVIFKIGAHIYSR